MLLACIDMMCLCVDAMDQHKKQAYTRVGCFFLCTIDVVKVPQKIEYCGRGAAIFVRTQVDELRWAR